MTHDFASTPIINVEDLSRWLDDNGTQPPRILDASFVLPGSSVNPHQNFYNARIGEAVFFDITKICDTTSDLPHMLCSPENFSSTVAHMGIDNTTPVIIYGQQGMIMGPARAWWMFKYFGHDKVAVLNGGLPAWQRAGLPLNTDAPVSPTLAKAGYKAVPDAQWLAHIGQVESALDDETTLILDARSPERFNGASPEPRAGLRSGHIPGSVNLPCSALIDSQTGLIKPREELQNLLTDAGFEETGDAQRIITSCGSGVTACVLALAMDYLGHKNWSVYDGSWAEWGQNSLDTPINSADH